MSHLAPRAGLPAFALAALCLFAGSAPVAVADCDLAPPALTTFTLSPASIDVTTGAKTTTCTMGLTDDLSGVDSASCTVSILTVIPPMSFVSQSAGCSAVTPTSGTRTNGTFACTITVPRYSANGQWPVSLSATDNVQHTLSVTQQDLITRGLPDHLTVTSTPDTTPPAISSFDFNAKAVNVTAASANVTCTSAITDSPAGVASFSCVFQSPPFGNPSRTHTAACSASTPTTGTAQNGTFSCTATVPRYANPGTWKVATVSAFDAVNNFTVLATTDLTTRGFPTDLAVTDTNPDLVAPTFGALDWNPKTVDVSNGSKVVACTIPVTDSLAGVQFASCSFTSPQRADLSTQTESCTAFTPTSGDVHNGTWTCNVTIPQYSENGTWTPSFEAIDAVSNPATTSTGTLQVTCGGATTPEPTETFPNATTLNWTAVAGATRYNVYRGLTSTLSSSYGTCLGTATGTSFALGTTRPANGTSFTYLVDYNTATLRDQGLGTTSSGTPRTIASPCP